MKADERTRVTGGGRGWGQRGCLCTVQDCEKTNFSTTSVTVFLQRVRTKIYYSPISLVTCLDSKEGTVSVTETGLLNGRLGRRRVWSGQDLRTKKDYRR